MSFPNFHLNPGAYHRVVIGGYLVPAVLVEVDGMKLEGEWSEQKPTGSSGASWNWKGLKPAGPHKFTWQTARSASLSPADMFEGLRKLYEMLLPKPGSFPATKAKDATTKDAAAAPAPAKKDEPFDAERALKQAREALANLDNKDKAKDPTAGTTGDADAKDKPKKDAANPGPRPPTYSIESAWCNFFGTAAVALKSWEMKHKDNSTLHIVELNSMKPLVQAGTGLAPPKSADGSQGLTPAQRAEVEAAAKDALATAKGAGV